MGRNRLKSVAVEEGSLDTPPAKFADAVLK